MLKEVADYIDLWEPQSQGKTSSDSIRWSKDDLTENELPGITFLYIVQGPLLV